MTPLVSHEFDRGQIDSFTFLFNSFIFLCFFLVRRELRESNREERRGEGESASKSPHHKNYIDTTTVNIKISAPPPFPKQGE